MEYVIKVNSGTDPKSKLLCKIWQLLNHHSGLSDDELQLFYEIIKLKFYERIFDDIEANYLGKDEPWNEKRMSNKAKQREMIRSFLKRWVKLE